MEVYCISNEGQENFTLVRPKIGNIYTPIGEVTDKGEEYYRLQEFDYDHCYPKKMFAPLDYVSIEELTEILENELV